MNIISHYFDSGYELKEVEKKGGKKKSSPQ